MIGGILAAVLLAGGPAAATDAVLDPRPANPREIPSAPEMQAPPQDQAATDPPAAPPATSGEAEGESEDGPKEPIVVRDHRTVRSYPANLGHNIVEVWRKPSLVPLLVGTAATAALSPFDDNVVGYFERHPMESYGNAGKVVGSGVVGVGVSTALFGIGRYANGDRFRAATYDMSQAVVVNFIYTTAIKEAVKRRRPDGSDRLSFPSGHSSNAFAAATVWVEQYGWKAAVPGYAIATWVAGSRLALAKHHLSDVAGGAVLGIIVGHSVARWDAKPSRKPVHGAPNAWWIAPDTGPDGTGMGLALNVRF